MGRMCMGQCREGYVTSTVHRQQAFGMLSARQTRNVISTAPKPDTYFERALTVVVLCEVCSDIFFH
jgi:hypothetical protein